MSSVYLVVEGHSDAELLRRLLPPGVREKLRFIVGDGKSSAISTARTLLAIGDRAVGLLVDADTDKESAISREQRILTDLLRKATKGLAYEVFLAVPTLDHIYAHHGPVNKIPVVRDITVFVKKNTQ